MARKYFSGPDIWGGLECSFNRVKDRYMDQLSYCGHYPRAVADIDRIAALGIKVMRYPVIWERLHPQPGHTIDWSTVDSPLNALRQHGITPIAGLVHHGSGPRYADILSTSFPAALAGFAAKAAERFPWIDHYTPVNEPLTTARFSGLYGLWFPHRRSDHAFAHALLNQMKAVVLSMQEIRKVNPAAKLVQTEDLAKVYSTAHLQYQAEFENHRRWLTCDLLCGMVDRDHPLWDYLIHSGITEDHLKFFIDNPCPPDIVGVDYYATSERYLDEDMEKYPVHTHGSNHFENYADVEAIRVRHGEVSGFGVLLQECWHRYELPIAVTEVHINCDADNQIRWFAEIRNTCSSLVEQGVDIRGVTAWALFGAYGWNQLLTKPHGEYEAGVFDMRAGEPVPTPLAEYLVRLSKDPGYIHPAEDGNGWWQREDRFFFDREEELALGDTSPGGCSLRGDNA